MAETPLLDALLKELQAAQTTGDTARVAQLEAQVAQLQAEDAAEDAADLIEDAAYEKEIAARKAEVETKNQLIAAQQKQIADLKAGTVTPPPVVTAPVSGDDLTDKVPAGFPYADNTGVPKGIVLKASGSVSSSAYGQVIEGLDIKGNVVITHPNVTLKNCKITASSFYSVQIKQGVAGAIVQDCEINGGGAEGCSGIAGCGKFYRNKITKVENGFSIQGSLEFEVIDNYVFDMYSVGSPHYDAIQIDGGNKNGIVRHNSFINHYGQTAAVMIDNYFGPIDNIKVDNNFLYGGGYTVYCDGQFSGGTISNVSFTNNVFGGSPQYGLRAFTKTNPIWTGNKDTTGKAV